MRNILVNDDAEALADKLGQMPTYQREAVLNEVLFKFWAGFAAFWMKRRGEHVTWSTFALRPHNLYYFLAWAFNTYPSLPGEVVAAIDAYRENTV